MFQQAIKNFKINYNVGNVSSTFTSGDLMTGHLSFDLTKETKVTSITIEVAGQAKVHWSTGGGKNSSRRHINDKREYFNLKGVILQANGAVGGSLNLQPGTHVYPFTCQLPQGDFPSSFKGCYGIVVYTTTICIHRPWHMSKEYQSEFLFASHFDINQPGLGAPVSGTNSKTLCCLCCASGPITFTASTEKKAFVPGEIVKIICNFSNSSSRKATPKVKLKQRQIFYAHNRVNKRMVVETLSFVTGDVVRAYTSDVHTEIMLPIPSYAALTISNCSIIDLNHMIEVSLSVRGAPDLKVLIPIILCSIPVSAQPPPYSSGDYITGQVTLELEKECKVDSLSVKLKGKAEVQWTENYGNTIVTYHNKNKFFSIQQFLINVGQGCNIVDKGCHVYPFTFQIPEQDLPSSFKGAHGKIVYSLKAYLSRSMRMDSKAKAKLTLIQRRDLNSDPVLKTPQQSITEKKMKLFSSGKVGMDVNIQQTGFQQGQDIQVVASILNKSSHDVKPKYCLYSKYSYFAKGRRRVQTKDILKEVGDPIPPSAGQTVTRTITIPPTTNVSVSNCKIIKVEYRLRVSLDVKFASDPEIKFPIVILPALQESDNEHKPAYNSYGYEAFASSDMLGGMSFLQNPTASGPSAPPPAYGTHEMYPPRADFYGKS